MALRFIQVAAGVCRYERKARAPVIKQSRVAAALDVDQSTIARFEKGFWPEDLEATVGAYAETFDIRTEDLMQRIMDVWKSPELQEELMLAELFQDARADGPEDD